MDSQTTPFTGHSAGQITEFTVSLKQFDGPLDLMLHLVRKNQLDLFDLNLDILAGQYIDYLNQCQSLSLEITSEYLVELATLLEYKSRRLVKRQAQEEEEDNWQQDQRDLLASRLMEYEKIQQQASLLEKMFEERMQKLDRDPASLIDTWQKPVEITQTVLGSPARLVQAMNRVLKRQAILNPYETKVEVKELSVEERMEQILMHSRFGPAAITLEELLPETCSLHFLVVTFLALLELAHDGKAEIWSGGEDTIWMKQTQ